MVVACVLAVGGALGCGGQPSAPVAPSEVRIGSANAGPLVVGPSSTPESAVPSEDDVVVPIWADDAVRGDRRALVTFVVFSDFQCPFCARFASTLDRVRDHFNADVRIVFKHHPLAFHVHAKQAAEVAEGVRALRGNVAFWQFHDIAFRRQSTMSPETIRGWAIAAGVDGAEIDAGLASGKWRANVERGVALAATLQSIGTPATFINGRLVEGAQTFEALDEIVSEELSKASELERAGIPRTAIYRAAVEQNFKARPRSRGDDDDDDSGITRVRFTPSSTSPAPISAPISAKSLGAVRTGPPLGIVDLAKGKGRPVVAGDTIVVRYVGTLADGTVFDTSAKSHGGTFTFKIGDGRTIKGWEEGLLGMTVGSRRKLTVPPDLAYGESGHPPTIPPKATLLFEIDLVAIQ